MRKTTAMNRTLVLFTTLILALSLSACGFHLKGRYQMASEIQMMSLVTAQPGEFEENLIEQFGYRGIELLTDSAEPEYGLVILDKRETVRELGNDQVELRFELSYLINDREQNNLMSRRQLLTDRRVRFDSDQPDDRQWALDQAWEDMHQEVIHRMFNQVSILKPGKSS